LLEKVENFGSEMSNAALEAISYFTLHREWPTPPHFATPEMRSLLSGAALAPLECFQEVSQDRQRTLLARCTGHSVFALFMLSIAIGQSLSGT
jgi:hypothetical protein